MNTKNSNPYWLVMGLPLTVGGVLIAGCSQQNGATGTTAQPVAQTDAPAGSSAHESHDKTGGDHHANAADETKAHTHSTKLAFSAQSGVVPVGKPATWTLKVTDAASGAPVKDFDEVHDKLMHLIVVKKDLSWFNHIHPEHKGDGTFTVTTTLPTAGSYKLYADYTPKGRTQEVPQHEFATAGAQASLASSATSVSLVADKVNNGWITKKVTAHPEGQPNAKGGATYEVALMPMPLPVTAGKDVMLHFQIRDGKGQPIKDLQPYLGAMGHAVVLSSDTQSYLHSHPMEGGMDEMGGMKHDMSKMGNAKPGNAKMGQMKHSAPPKSSGPDVMFHTNFPTAGLYKAWGQFMHKGRVITAAFVVDVDTPDVAVADESQPHSHDESQPHNH